MRSRFISGVMTFDHEKKMVCKYGSSEARFHNLSATVMLSWRAIKDARNIGMKELDLRRSDLGHSGVVTFKEQWSTACASIAPAEIVFPPVEHFRVRLVREVCACLPDNALT